MKKEVSLESVDSGIEVKIEKGFDPKGYFKTRKGLWVSGSFAEKILSAAETTKDAGQFSLASFKLLKYSTDKEIEAELPKNHLFSETEVCAVIASLLEKQPKGKDGVLINDGNWNLFYTPAFVVSVTWSADDSEWIVYCWHRGGHGWRDGSRVFSPAN